MATKIVCDLDGNGEAVTVRIALDNDSVTIDLCEEHLTAVRKMLEMGRPDDAPTPSLAVPMPFVQPVETTTSMDPKSIRAWATANGYEVSPKGRIPADVVMAYRKAN